MYNEEKIEMKEGESTISFHISYVGKLQLKELIEILNCISKGYNDALRKEGKIANNKLSMYHPTIENVNSGSIVLVITVNICITTGLALILIRHWQNRCKKIHKKTKLSIKTKFLELDYEGELFPDK